MIVYGAEIDGRTRSLELGHDPPEWVEGLEPVVRWRPAGILDPGGGGMTVFGGSDGSAALNDAWTLNAGDADAGWSKLNPSGMPSTIPCGTVS